MWHKREEVVTRSGQCHGQSAGWLSKAKPPVVFQCNVSNRYNFYNGRRNLGTGLPPLSTNFLGSSSGSLLQSYVLC